VRFVGEYVESKRPSRSDVAGDQAPWSNKGPGRGSVARSAGDRRRPWVPMRDRPPAVRRVQFGDR